MKRLSFLVTLVATVLAVAACDKNRIEVTITPAADGSFVRQVRFWTEQEDGSTLAPSEKLLLAPEGVYGKALAAPGPAVSFRGTFRAVPPDLKVKEVANRGGLTVWHSPLGRACYYRERFPGRIDAHAALREMGEVLETLTEIAATMAEQHLAGEAGVEKVAAAFRGSIREDAKNIATLLWSGWASGNTRMVLEDPDDDLADQLIWALLFCAEVLEERGYLKVEDLPRDIDGLETVGWRWLARTMGRPADAALRGKLAFLSDSDAMAKAMTRACEARGIDRKAFEEKAGRALVSLIPLSFVAPRITLRLRLPGEPLLTNGKWDAGEGSVRFETELSAARPLAPFAYAGWVVPDTAWQERRLGRVALVGKDLRDVAMWEASLAAGQRRAWRAALEALDRSGDLGAQIRAIRVGEKDEVGRGAKTMLKALGLAEEGD